MEKTDCTFTVSPKNILLNESEDIIRFNVKNLTNKSSHFQIFLPDYQHFKIFGDRTFTIAPGITKNIKIQHSKSGQCSSLNSKIQIADGIGNKNYVYFKCFQEKVKEVKVVDIPEQLKLQKLKINQQKCIEIPVKNLSQVNLRVKAFCTLPNFLADKIQVTMEQDHMILLKGTSKTFKLKLKILKQAELSCKIVFEFLKQESKLKWVEQVKIFCNSLQRSQFIADNQLNRIDYIQHEILNGTSVKGTVTLINNYHQDCPFKLLEIIQIDDYKSYYHRLQQITLKMQETQGVIQAKSEKKINYQIFTKPNQNDRNFTMRYGQLQPKDEVNAYKLKNSNYFRKNLQLMLKVQFGVDNANYCKLRAHVVNPALKISRTSSKNSETIEVANDTNLEIPFKIINNLYFNASITKGKLKCGVNSLQIQWRKGESPFISKQNIAEVLKCTVKMGLPQNQIVLYEPVCLLKRPKTALLRSQSANILGRSQLRQKITHRAPTKVGDVGIKGFKEVSASDFTQKPNKYLKGQALLQQEFKLLQINQNQKGNVITNAHPQKNLIAFFPDKGYLLLQSQHSYLLNYEKKGIKFELCGKGFEVKNKQVEDNQIYKIVKKQLLFCFSQQQKQFQVVRQIEVINKSNQFLMVYCLSIDDEFFHSLQKDNKILIAPKGSSFYKISFYPTSQRKVKQRKISRQLQFLIGQQKQLVTCEGDFLSADVVFDQKSIQFNNCLYSQSQITKNLILFNSGLNKVTLQIQNSQFIKVAPKMATIPQKGKQTLTFSFCPSKLSKKYEQQIKVCIKGSHVIKIPFIVNTLQPDIYCQQEIIDFKQGYINQTLTAYVTIKNQNVYPCKLNFNFDQITFCKSDNKMIIQGQSFKKHELKMIVSEVGQKLIELPPNFLQLQGYGVIKGPKYVRTVGKKTILQLVPDNPFKDLICSQIQEIKKFKIKNISQAKTDINLILTNNHKERLVILSCQPNSAQLYPGQQKQFVLHSIRADQDSTSLQSRYINYNLSINFKNRGLYRNLDFMVCLPPPQLQITPQDVYFPLVSVGIWSKSTFTICNKGYKQVFIAIKKPANVLFELDFQFDKKDNRLTKLKNTCEVSVLFKSKKPISFRVVLEIENNFGKKYQVKLNGTASKSPLLNCDRLISSSHIGFSSRQFKPTTQSSLQSVSGKEVVHQDSENIRFFSRWIHGIFPESTSDNEYFYIWLKHSKNLLSFLHFINAGIYNLSKEDMNLNSIIEQLKKLGYPIYTIQKEKLIQGNANQWAMFLWSLLSKDFVIEDCLKWVNKICGINLQTFENAFNHHKKILVDLLSRILEPLYKARVTEWQKIVQLLEPSIPILSKIENKRQFALLLNILYNKFYKLEKKHAYTSDLAYQIKFHQDHSKESIKCWILATNSFQHQLSANCSHEKYTPQKKLVTFAHEGEASANLKIKEDVIIMVWNSSFYESAKLIQLIISKKPPIFHNIMIQCQDKCTQEWKLQFVCQIESEYFFEFSGGLEFKCKMPDVGVIQAGQIMEFRVLYSPTNLKQHQGVLKICNKCQEHIYNLKGKPLRSNFIQIQKTVKVQQAKRWVQTFSIPDQTISSENCVYKIQEIGPKSEELKLCQAKSNKKEIILKIELQFLYVVQNKEMILRITNNDLTFCRNIRLIINVVPKPIAVQAELRGIVEKVTAEKIPVTNCLAVKQPCYVSIHRLTKQEFFNFNLQNLDLQQSLESQKGQFQFKLSHIDKINLKPKQTVKIQLSYLPFTLNESFCQIRLKFKISQEVIVYNFMGIPQLSTSDNPLTVIQCEVQKESTHSIRIPNKLKQKMNFDVQTSIKFVAGPDQITLLPKENFIYSFKMLPLHAGEFLGQLIFKSEKLNLSYPLQINVVQNKKIRKIRVLSKIRVTSTLQIKLYNKSDKQVQYEVCCNSQFISFDPKFVIPQNSQKHLLLHYTPLFVGTKNAVIKLFNENMQEICYYLEMLSQEHKEAYKYNCQLGEKKKIKLVVKNQTSIDSKIFEPKLPAFLATTHEAFPISLPAYTNAVVQLVYTKKKLQKQQSCTIQIQTDLIGLYTYELAFHIANEKIMPNTIIAYDFHQVGEQIYKEFYLEILNPFDEIVNYAIQTQKIQYNQNILIKTDDQKFTLKSYGTKHLKFATYIKSYDLTEKDWQLQHLNDKIYIVTGDFKLTFPIRVLQIHTMKSKIQINGPCQQLARSRVTLRHVMNLKNWQISNFPQYKDIMNIAYLSSKDVYLEVIINKTCDFVGEATFFDQQMVCAEKYPLHIKVTGKKIQTVNISANVGEKGRVDIKIKNGKGKFKVQIKNNKLKEFDVLPKEGEFNQKDDNLVRFEYNPKQYNGFKKAEATIYSQSGIFSFLLVGKFPHVK